MPFSFILAEAVFCGNAMLIVNGNTPYSAMFGRVPSLLPSISQVASTDETTQSSHGLVCHAHRLCETSIQAMVEGSIRARLGHAMNARTPFAAHCINRRWAKRLTYFGPPSSKDTSGWPGPAEVVDVSRTIRGIASIRHMEVQIPKSRRHLY